jgi:hypothetical protein
LIQRVVGGFGGIAFLRHRTQYGRSQISNASSSGRACSCLARLQMADTCMAVSQRHAAGAASLTSGIS